MGSNWHNLVEMVSQRCRQWLFSIQARIGWQQELRAGNCVCGSSFRLEVVVVISFSKRSEGTGGAFHMECISTWNIYRLPKLRSSLLCMPKLAEA